jgi:hypothetical protein
MEIEMVFNELSAENLNNDKFQARDLMSELVMTLQTSTKAGVSRIFRTRNDMNSIELAPEYSIAKWRNDPDVERELKSFLRSLNNRSPYCDNTIAAIQAQFDLADVSFNGQQSEGLRFAAITQSIAISLASSPKWDKSTLLLDLEEIEPDGEIIFSEIEIKHASFKRHIEEIIPWIKKQISSDIEDGKQLWVNRSNLFDRIEFCDCVEKQLTDILAGDPKLIHIVNVFSTLNQKCQSWDAGSLCLEGLDESGESESTMNNSNFRKKRTFRCPDGQERVFERHIKLKVFNWRIHFLAESSGRVIIGYVGTHLPTTKYPT